MREEIPLRLRQLRMRNFRCYRDEVSINFDDLTALIGRNDSGKSSILEAIEMFLDDAAPDKDDACKHGNPRDLAIIGIFDEVPEKLVLDQEAETSLQDEYLLNSDGQLEIHKIFNGSLEKPKISALKPKLVAVHPSAKNIDDLVSLNNADLKKPKWGKSRAKEFLCTVALSHMTKNHA